MILMAQTFAYQSVQYVLIQCSGTNTHGIANFVIIQMKTNSTCQRCGKTNPANVHTCTPKEVMEQALKKQDQSTDSNPIGYLLWETGSGWWEFVEEEPVDYYDYKAVYVRPPRPEPARKPMTEEEIQKHSIFWLLYDQESFVAGIRFAEKHHGIKGEEE